MKIAAHLTIVTLTAMLADAHVHIHLKPGCSIENESQCDGQTGATAAAAKIQATNAAEKTLARTLSAATESAGILLGRI